MIPWWIEGVLGLIITGFHLDPIHLSGSSEGKQKGLLLHPINYDRALLCAISHKIMVYKNKRIKRKICFGQAVAVHVPLVIL